MKNKLYSHLVVAILGILLGFLAVKCNPNTFIDCDKMDCYTLDSTITNTEYLPGKETIKWDTTVIDNTIKNPVTSTVTALNDSSDVHTAFYKDSVLEAKVTSYIRGIIDSQSVDYKVTTLSSTKSRVDTLKITTINYISPKSYSQVYLGGNIEGNATYVQYGANLAVQPKNSKIIYEIGYNINQAVGNNFMVGVKFPLFKWK